jgi:hypothetical protein
VQFYPVRIQENITRELRMLNPKVPVIRICSYFGSAMFETPGGRSCTGEQGISQSLIEAIFKLAGDSDE